MENLDRIGPVLVMFLAAALVLLADLLPAPPRRRFFAGVAVVAAVLATLWALWLIGRGRAGGEEDAAFSGALVLDRFSLFFTFLFPWVAAFVALASLDYLDRLADRAAEFYALLFTITGGAMLL